MSRAFLIAAALLSMWPPQPAPAQDRAPRYRGPVPGAALAETLACSPDGRLVAASGRGCAAFVWDLKAEKETALPTGFKGPATGLAFSPDGRALATGSASDGTVVLWDTRTWRPLDTITQVGISGRVAFSPDGKLLAMEGRSAWVYDLATRRVVGAFCEKEFPCSVAFSPDSRLLAAGSGGKREDPDHPGEVVVWEVKSRRRVFYSTPHTLEVKGLAFSPDGRLLASGSSDGTARLWDLETGKERAVFRLQTRVLVLLFSPDGSQLLVGCRPLHLFDVRTQKEVWSLDPKEGIKSAAWVPGTALLATVGTDHGALLWEVPGAQPRDR